MRYRPNPPGYYDNPLKAKADYEAESKRIEAVVQHVLARVGFREVRHAFRQAKEQKKLNPLIADALKIMQSLSFPKKFIEVASAALVQPGNVSSTFGTDEAYYLDGNKPPYSSDDDPGVFVDDLSDYSTLLAEQMRRRGPGGVVQRRLHSTDFLTHDWPRVTDSDVQNAVAILQEEGVSFYRRYKISEDAWVAKHGPDSVEDYTGSHLVKKAPLSRDEFLRSRVARGSNGALRVNVGRVIRELRKLDLAPDDVVYRHGGTNNSIGGASARGFYVAQLRPGQLIPEGMSPPVGLGICVGGEDYQRQVREGEMTIYGIRAPSGKPKFTISVDDRGIEQVKGAANRLPGFDPGSGEFKGEAGVDEVRAVVEFLMVFLGMERQDKDFAGGNLRPGILAMQRAGIDPFSPPVKGQTWERAQKERQAKIEDIRRRYVALRVAYYLARHPELAETALLSQPDDAELREWAAEIYSLQDYLLTSGGPDIMSQVKEEIDKQLSQYVPPEAQIAFFTRVEAEEAAEEAGVPPPRRRQNPDPLASYSDPEVAALALAAYERPMGGMWTYEDEE